MSCLNLNTRLPRKNDNQQTSSTYRHSASKSFYNLFPLQRNQTFYLKLTNIQIFSIKELCSFEFPIAPENT